MSPFPGPTGAAGRLLGRLGVESDVLQHLAVLRYLGEAFEGRPPVAMLPGVVRTIARAVRTAVAVHVRPGWLWPRWIERQVDPADAAFVPRGPLPALTNVTARNWTLVGSLGVEDEAIVDPTGLVTPSAYGWSLDWWVGANDGWHFPSRHPDVRQELVGAAPVVRTSMGLGEGQAAQTVWAPLEGERHVLVEVENRSPDPIEVAVAVRPYNPEALAVVESIRLEGATVVLNDAPALWLPAPPRRAWVSRFVDDDTSTAVAGGLDGVPPEQPVSDPAGLLQAAFVFPLPSHRAIRWGAAVGGTARRPKQGRLRRSPPPARTAPRLDGPGAKEVAASWRRALARGTRVSLPDQRLQDAVDANRAYLLLLLDGDDLTAGPHTYHRFWFRDAAYELAALGKWGFHEEAAAVIAAFPRRQRPDGWFFSQWGEWDSTGAAIWALAEHRRLSGDDTLARAMHRSVLDGVRWIAGKTREERRRGSGLSGLMPPGISAEHLGPFDFYYWDDFWSLRGLLDAVVLLETAGDGTGAAEALLAAESLWRSLHDSLEVVAQRLGRQIIPAGPARGIDPGMIGSLAACYPLRLFDADDPWIRGTLEVLRERFTLDGAFYQGISHTGLGTYLTLQLAFVELEDGDGRAWERLRWMLGAATPTFTWPEAIHPRLGGGCMGDGHHGWAAADFLSFVRNVLVREAPDGSIALLTLLPQEWTGSPIRVEDAPTHAGRVSFDVRWEGEEAVLGWECERPGARLVAPGLDGRWTATQQGGTARLRAGGP